ncbi:MAG TPA: hypothetical protein VLA72_03720 [Anaerolineales bacterium]|nr:hypothetical protein [Anaerolineales bacterium]
MLVDEGAQYQSKHIGKWGKKTGSTTSREEILAGANHQIRVWRSLLNLAEMPTDETRQRLFWNLVMQYSYKYEKISAIKKRHEKVPDKIDLTKLNKCWKAIKDETQHLPELWETRSDEDKLYLKHGKTNMTDVWKLWSKTEKREWEYIRDRVKSGLK